MGDVLLSHPPKALCWVGEIVSKVGERDQSSDISWDLGNVLETVHESGRSHDVTWWASSWRRGALSTNCPCPLLGGEGWVWVRLGFLWEEQESSMGKEMLLPPKMLVLATEIKGGKRCESVHLYLDRTKTWQRAWLIIHRGIRMSVSNGAVSLGVSAVKDHMKSFALTVLIKSLKDVWSLWLQKDTKQQKSS